MNIYVQISVQVSAFTSFWYIPRSKNAGPHSNLKFVHKSYHFPQQVHLRMHIRMHFTFPPAMQQGLQFLHIIANMCYFVF